MGEEKFQASEIPSWQPVQVIIWDRC
jgi:hypothetical protein